MEILLIIAVIAFVLWWVFMRDTSKNEYSSAPYKVETPQVNNQITDAVTQQPAWHTAPPDDVKPVELTDALDVNKDGKVNLEDVKEVVKKVRKPRAPKAEKPAAKKAAPKKAAAMKATKKPRSKKA